MLIDLHCHLNYKGLIEEQEAVLARARARGSAPSQHLHAGQRMGRCDRHGRA
jgi:Tat protein secretion system quality control protein TatD with DNase activity